MSEVLFYHLERQPLEAVLPQLVERSLERNWKCLIRTPLQEHVAAIDALLWTWRDDSFIAHGTKADGDADKHPVFITDSDDNPNSADICFLLDRAEPLKEEEFQRIVCMFDGRDEESVAAARTLWKRLKDDGHDCTYWQQSDEGRWEKKA